MLKSFRNGRRGFTLIELMIASVIMTVGLFAIIHLQVVVVRGNAYSREISEASELADGVCGYLSIQARKWVHIGPDDHRPLTDVDYFNSFYIGATPDPGDDFSDVDDLRALEDLSINSDPALNPGTISSGTGPENALAVTNTGLPKTIAPGMESLRDLYRVNYLAYRSRLTPNGMPSDDLITVIVFVSWDNKDHGRQVQDWTDWYDEDHFFERHMVVKRIMLKPRRIW